MNGEKILQGTEAEKAGGLSVMGFCGRKKSRLTKKNSKAREREKTRERNKETEMENCFLYRIDLPQASERSQASVVYECL